MIMQIKMDIKGNYPIIKCLKFYRSIVIIIDILVITKRKKKV